MVKKRICIFIIIILFIIDAIAIAIFLNNKYIKAANSSKVLEGNIKSEAGVIGNAEIGIIDGAGNTVGEIAKTDENGNYAIKADITSTNNLGIKVKLKYEDVNISFTCKKINQIETIYSRVDEGVSRGYSFKIRVFTENTEYNKDKFNIIKEKLNKINATIIPDYDSSNISDCISNMGLDPNRANLTNVILYFGTMTEEERENRERLNESVENPVRIIEVGKEASVDSAIQALADAGYIKIEESETELEFQQDGEYAIGKGIKTGPNIKINCSLQRLDEGGGETPENPNNKFGSGDDSVNISGKIKIDGDSNMNLENLNGNITMYVKTDTNSDVAHFTITNVKNFNFTANLSKEETYYIEYKFTDNTFSNGFSTQEFYIDKTSSDSEDEDNRTITRYASDDDVREVRHERYKNQEIDNNIENDLDNNTVNENILIARTKEFTIEKLEDDEIGYMNNIETGFTLTKRPDFEMELKKYISGVKIVLQDGTEFFKETETLNFVGTTGSLFKIIHMDDEIMHGATVYVEYTIEPNISKGGEQFISVTVRDLLDDVDNNGGVRRNIYYDPNCELITEKRRNKCNIQQQCMES